MQAREEVTELHRQLANYMKDKQSLEVSYSSISVSNCTWLQNAKARLKVQDAELKSIRWEHEVLEQRFSQVRSSDVKST